MRGKHTGPIYCLFLSIDILDAVRPAARVNPGQFDETGDETALSLAADRRLDVWMKVLT